MDDTFEEIVKCSLCKEDTSMPDILSHACFEDCGVGVILREGVAYPSHEDEQGDVAEPFHPHDQEEEEMGSAKRKAMMDFWAAPANGECTADVAEMLLKIVYSPHRQAQLMDKRTKKDNVWKEINEEMVQQGFVMPHPNPAAKCKEKYYNIQSAYLKFKRNATTTGKSAKRVPRYFKTMDGLLAKPMKEQPLIIDTLATEISSSGSLSPRIDQRFAPKRQPSHCDELLKYMKERDEKAQRRHEEFLEVTKSALAEEINLKKRELELREREAEQRDALLQFILQKTGK